VTRFALLRAAWPAVRCATAAGWGRAVVRAENCSRHRGRWIESRTLADLLFARAGPPPEDRARSPRTLRPLLRVRRDVARVGSRRGLPPRWRRAAARAEVASRLRAHQEGLVRSTPRRPHSTRQGALPGRSSTCTVGARRVAARRARNYLASRSLVPKGGVWRDRPRDVAPRGAPHRGQGPGVCRALCRQDEPERRVLRGGSSLDRWDRCRRRGPRRRGADRGHPEPRRGAKVAACLAADPQVAPAIVPRPNPTLRESDGEWTYWKPASPRNPTDEEVHASVKDHPALRAFVEEAARGVHRSDALVRAVAARNRSAEAGLQGQFDSPIRIRPRPAARETLEGRLPRLRCAPPPPATRASLRWTPRAASSTNARNAGWSFTLACTSSSVGLRGEAGFQ